MTTDTVTVNEDEKPEALQEQAQVEPNQQEANDSQEVKEEKEQTVPLSALQKERKKRQDAERENQMFREYQMKQMQAAEKPQEEDESQYEPVTKADLKTQQQAQYAQMLRDVEERSWLKQNPEKAEIVNEKLTDFLKKRPNLARAIEDSTNRYEEAWTLMEALTPKQKAELKKAAPKKETPGSPAAVPKAASINQSVDIMNMSDKEFDEWRKAQRKR